MRILVAGAAGMLGREVTAACHARDHEVVALAHAALDITDPAAVDRELSRYEPDAVVNCAAFTDVDGAEDDEAGAMRVNDEAAAQLAAAEAAQMLGAEVAVGGEAIERPRLAEARCHIIPEVPEPVVCLPRSGKARHVGVNQLDPVRHGLRRGRPDGPARLAGRLRRPALPRQPPRGRVDLHAAHRARARGPRARAGNTSSRGVTQCATSTSSRAASRSCGR